MIPITPANNNPFGSHQAVLNAVVASPLVGNRVLEFGLGGFSTGILYKKARQGNEGLLLSFETDIKYVKQFESYQDIWFTIFHVQHGWNWVFDNHPAMKERWNLVFVDQHPYPPRVETINRLKDQADYIILHDAVHLIGYPKKEREYTDYFKYAQEYPVGGSDPRTFPNTIIGSNFHVCEFKI